MDKKTVNNSVVKFLKSTKGDHSELIELWESKGNQAKIFKPKVKNSRKTAFMFFAEFIREECKQFDPPLTAKKEVQAIVSERWAKLKEKGGSDLEKFERMSVNYSAEHDNDETTVPYQVKKPFHKYCLAVRRTIEKENEDKNAVEITEILKENWMKMTRNEKAMWNL